MSKVSISGTGCALADLLYTNIDFRGEPFSKFRSRVSGDGGVGTKYDNRSEFAGRRTELTYESVAQERPTRLQFRGTNKTATATDTLTFSSGKCRQPSIRADHAAQAEDRQRNIRHRQSRV